jgi:GDSL-like lipase/acylhydrolase family protein/VCBS repeat protein
MTLGTLENEKKIHNPNWVFPEAVVDIYCGDTHPTRKNVCRYRKNPRDPNGPLVTQYASSWTERGWFWNTYSILLCPRFFQEKTSLEAILHDMATGKRLATNASEYKNSWGHTIYHELVHLDPIIASEEVWDVTYGACTVAKLANQNGCSGRFLWNPPGWDNRNGEPHSLINADSWAFFASGVYFQKAAKLSEPGEAINDCGIYTGESLTNFSQSSLEYVPEGILLPVIDRADGTYNNTSPTNPAPENMPPDDPPTPALPYTLSPLPPGLATPFDALAYFATYTPTPTAIPTAPPIAPVVSSILHYTGIPAGKPIKPGVQLRILGIGDSITVGFLSDRDGGDGNGYQGQLKSDLSKDQVVYAGTESSYGTMGNSYYAAWSGKTIKFITDNMGRSLEQRPNIVLIHAGTNDMNPNGAISTEGNDPDGAAQRLGTLIDKVIDTCPDSIILVAMIINTCDPAQSDRTQQFQRLVPGIVDQRRNSGKKVLTVDFTSFPTSQLRDCIHPTNNGYHLFGDYWYNFISQVPSEWINAPIGPDPDRSQDDSITANGGPDRNIPPPNWGSSPVVPGTKAGIADAAKNAANGEGRICNVNPHWFGTGKIALGLGRTGDWHYNKNWVQGGKIADGIHMDHRYVRLHDMNGDGKADYLWVDPISGETRCWINNLPNPWSPAGSNNDIIASGAGQGRSVFFADMNGDRMEDYLVVNPNSGHVDVYWNYGPDKNWANGWKFVPGGQLASGVPHANWATLRFPDINGDGRADYVIIGENGALGHWLNTGQPGSQDVLFVAQGGIATGASNDLSKVVFADMNGDGRDDYLIWDTAGGLTGFLNQPTNMEGVPLYINQGPAKTIADGITQDPAVLQLVDMDGDGKDDYVYIDQDGALWIWYNRGTVDDTMAIDGIRFADIDGDGLDDYIWIDPVTGAPLVYLNAGPNNQDILGWFWNPLNSGKPIASGAGSGNQVKFGDIDGDGKADYLVLDPKTGKLDVYLNLGPDASTPEGWRWKPIGTIASGLGPGADIRFADIDGDGFDDYIFLHPDGGTTIYRNVFFNGDLSKAWAPFPQVDASGIKRRPAEIGFYDING